MRQLIDDAERYTDLPVGRRDSGKLTQLPADQLCLKARLVLGNQQILEASFGFENFVIEEVCSQGLLDTHLDHDESETGSAVFAGARPARFAR